MGFEDIANSINSYLQDVADTNGYIIRFDNDPRATPADGLWLEGKIEFENSEQIELGINSYRNFGNLIITVKNSIGLGVGELLEVADVIITAFTTVEIGIIVFRVSSVSHKGRINDNWEIEVSSPFYKDEN